MGEELRSLMSLRQPGAAGRRSGRGFTLVEIMISLVIVVLMSAAFFVTFTGLTATDEIDRAAASLQEDLLLARSRAISSSVNQRISFLSTTQWRLQQYDDSAGTWVSFGNVRTMPLDTMLTDASYSNAMSNLVATPRGLYDLQGGATGEPYATVRSTKSTKMKSLNVAVGGAIEIKNE
jgi:prepilin-type N-terminal cleavage/methylation domain-containing protein